MISVSLLYGNTGLGYSHLVPVSINYPLYNETISVLKCVLNINGCFIDIDMNIRSWTSELGTPQFYNGDTTVLVHKRPPLD